MCFPDYIKKAVVMDHYNGISGKYAVFPKFVNFTLDYSCNVCCITCRDKNRVMPQENIEKLDKLIDPVFLPLLKDCEIAEADGAGEIFTSKYHKHLFLEISNRYPGIKFDVRTNGILINRENCIAYFGTLDRINVVSISMHAATEDTYDKIVKGGNFTLVMRNIKWLSELKKQGVIRGLNLGFVVQSLNYHEMKQFLELAISLDANALFWEYRPWGTEIAQNYKEYACFLPGHPKYLDMARILEAPVFDSPHCNMSGVIRSVKRENSGVS
jgi:MoaA/NifB/PqqE/SkfB family radical SAM enzyme